MARRTGRPGTYSAFSTTCRGLAEAGEPDGGRGVDDLGVELLLAEPGPLVHGRDLGDELGGEVAGVGERGLLREPGRGVLEDAGEELDRPGGRGDDGLGTLSQAEAQQDGLPHPLGVRPGAELVAPEAIELQPAGPLGLVGREADGDGAVGPGQASLGGLEAGHVPGRGDREDAAGPLDHGVPVIGGGRRRRGRCDGPGRTRPSVGPARRRCGSCRRPGRRAAARSASRPRGAAGRPGRGGAPGIRRRAARTGRCRRTSPRGSGRRSAAARGRGPSRPGRCAARCSSGWAWAMFLSCERSVVGVCS